MTQQSFNAQNCLATRGFSLTELLVAMAILLILAAVTLTYFSDYARTQQFVRFNEEVGRNLILARKQTVASKDDSQYGVYVGTSTVELFSGTTPTPGSASNTIVSFEGVGRYATSSFSNGLWYVTFSRVTGEASATGTIVVTDPSLGRTATYTVYHSGLIE